VRYIARYFCLPLKNVTRILTVFEQLLCHASVEWGHNALMTVVCLSVCLSVSLSVCPVTDTKSRTEWHGKLKISETEAHDTDNSWPHLEVERSKIKVIRPLNAVTENQSYLRNGKAYELQTWYTDGVRWPASPTCAVTSNLKALGHHLQGAGAIVAAAL